MNRPWILTFTLLGSAFIAACGMSEDDALLDEGIDGVQDVENDGLVTTEAALARVHPFRLVAPGPAPSGEFPVCLSTFTFEDRLTFNRCVPGKPRMLWRITAGGQITDGRGKCWEAYPDDDAYWSDVYLKRCDARQPLQRFVYASSTRTISFTTQEREKQYVCLAPRAERDPYAVASQSTYFTVNLNRRAYLTSNPNHCRFLLTFP
jgi:hypothetical protein